jgi:hypothetical protein
MDLGHQGARGVDRVQLSLASHPAYLGRDAVRRIQQRRAGRNFAQVLDKHGPLAAKVVHDVFVVDDLVIDINRRAEHPQGQIERLDRHVDTGTKAARAGKQDFHSGPNSPVTRPRGWHALSPRRAWVARPRGWHALSPRRAWPNLWEANPFADRTRSKLWEANPFADCYANSFSSHPISPIPSYTHPHRTG